MKLTFILGGLAGANVVLAFLTQWIILTVLGPGTHTDAFFSTMVVPQLFLAVLGGSIMQVLVPLLSAESEGSRAQEAWNFCLLLAGVFASLAFLLWATAGLWVRAIVPGFCEDAKTLSVSLARVQLVALPLMALSSGIGTVCLSRRQFLWPEVASLLGSSLALLFLLQALPKLGILTAAWALIIRSATETLLLLPMLGPFIRPKFRGPVLKTAWHRLIPLLLGTTYYKTDHIVDRVLASMAPPGQLSLLHLANQIYAAGNTIVGKAVSIPVFPSLSRAAAQGRWDLFRDLLLQRFLLLTGVTSLALLCLLFLGEPLLLAVFGHGRFDGSQIHSLRTLLFALGGVWVGGALGQILTIAFYATGDTTTPTKIGIVGFSLGICMKVGGFFLIGVPGIALAASLYYLFNTVAMASSQYRRLLGRGQGNVS